MGAQAAAYQVALVAEAAVLKANVYAAGLRDLVKAFESVHHAILAHMALAQSTRLRCLGFALQPLD